MEILLTSFSNKEIHSLIFAYIPEDKNKRIYYKLDIWYDERFNNYYDLIENIYEIFEECENGLERKVEGLIL